MTDPRRHVRRGDRLAVAAEQINFLNGLMRPGGGFSSGPLPGWQHGTNLILLKNTGVDVPRWAVLNITGIEIDPNASEYQANSFGEMPCVQGTKALSITGAAAVAIEPIKSGKVGRVAVTGVVQIKSADVSKVGSASVLWSSNEWALIVFGGSGARLGTISTTWTKGSTATVKLINADGTAITPTVEFQATNWFATIAVATAAKKVLCVWVQNLWLLAAAEC